MLQTQKYNAGFTLPETVIAIVLFTVVFGSLLSLFMWQGRMFSFQQSQFLAVSTTRNTLNEIREQGAIARRVLQVQDIEGTIYTSGNTTLVLQLPSISAAEVPIANMYDYVVFYLDGTRLWQHVQANPVSARHSYSKVVSESVSSLNFSYDNTVFESVRSFSIDLQAVHGSGAQVGRASLQSQVYLRNY